MVKSSWFVTIGIILILLGGGLFLVSNNSESGPGTGTSRAQPDWAPGTRPPSDAIDTVRRLSSSDPAERRAALGPDLNAIVADVNGLPEGANLVLDPQGWRGDETFAAATATLHVPDRPDQQLVIGFERIDGTWLVTFEESM